MQQGKMKNEQRHTQNIILTNRRVFFFSLCSLLFILNSCHFGKNKISLKAPSPFFTDLFTGNEDAVFRGINFNETSDAVKKIEKAKLYESTSDHLFYEFTYPKDSTPFSEYANLQYFFNEENQLDIITADIYLSDSIQEVKLKNTLTEYYNMRFETDDENESEYPVWKATFEDVKEDKKYNYSISLKEVSDDFGVSLEYMRE